MYYHHRNSAPIKPASSLRSFLASCVLGGILSCVIIFFLDLRLSAVVSTIALAQASNLFTETITNHIMEENLAYDQFVNMERNSNGDIIALTTNVSTMNQMRSTLIATVLESLEGVDISVIEVPLGSILQSEFFWAKGPTIQARAMSVGTISAEFQSEFSNSGINQTLHRIYLDITVPIHLMMAGNTIETTVETQLCVSETVIVGVVPDTNLQMGNLP